MHVGCIAVPCSTKDCLNRSCIFDRPIRPTRHIIFQNPKISGTNYAAVWEVRTADMLVSFLISFNITIKRPVVAMSIPNFKKILQFVSY
jgi:hypothetical protein